MLTNVFFVVSNLDNGLLEGPQAATILAAAPGFRPGTDTITNYDGGSASVFVSAPSTVSESGGWLSSGQVNSSAAVAADVAVRLSSSDPDKLVVPDFAIIAAGQSSARFGFAVLDNPWIDGGKVITITAAVPGWTPGQTQVRITDNENTNLSLTLPTQVNEGAGMLTNAGVVRINGILSTDLTVALTANLPARVQLPASVVIPAGLSSMTSSVTILDDSLTDGNQSVLVTASADGFASASRTVTVVDNDVYSFSFGSLPAAQIAGQPFAVTVYALNFSGSVVPSYSGTANLHASGMSGDTAVMPATVGPFTNGVWSGMVALPGANRGVVLRAEDGFGHSGSSSPFDLVAARILNLPAADLAYDALRNELLVGVVSNSLGNGQSVIPIDPATGNPGTPIPIGNDPSKLAISDDFGYLYASQEINSTGGVARIDLNSRSVDLRFAVGTVNQYGQSVNYVEDMKVQPGHPRTLVATTKIQYSYNQFIAVYDDGVQRPDVVSPVYYVRTYHIAFADSPSSFYVTKPNGIWINAITSTGASFLQEIAGSQYGADVVFANGFLYSTLGQILSTNDFSLVGSFPATGPVIPDSQNHRVYILTQSGSLTTFQAFDRNTLRPVGGLNLPNVSGQPSSFVQCGTNRFAFRTTGNQLYLVDTSVLYTNSAADLSLALQAAPAEPAVGSNLTYSIMVSNGGPASSFGVWLTNQIPSSSTLVSASSTVGTCTYTSRIVRCALGDMTNGAVAEVTIVVQPTIAGLQVNDASVSALSFDPIQTNNALTDIRAVRLGPGSPAFSLFCLPSSDIVFDPATQRIWASVPPSRYGLSNCVLSLDPFTGDIGNPVQVGRRPSKLAIAQAGQDLYVGLDEDSAVRRFNTVSQTLYPPFSIGDKNVANSMDVLPGAPQTVAVSRYSPLGQVYGDAALYDDGVARPATVQSPAVEFASDGTVLYGFGWDGNTLPNTSGDAFFANQVASNGLIRATAWTPHSFLGINSFDVADGVAYMDNGFVLDIASFTYVRRFNGIGSGPLVRVGNTNNQVFFLSNDGSNWVLQQFERTSSALLGSLSIPGVLDTPSSLICWSSNGVAFRTSSNQVVLVQQSMIPRVPRLTVEQSVSPLIGTVGSNLIYTVVVTNCGAGDAHNVILTDTLPAGATFVSAFTPQGSVTNVSASVDFALGTLSNYMAVTVTIVATPGIAGPNVNSNVVTSDFFTPSGAGNNSTLVHWVGFPAIPPLITELDLPLADIAYNPSNQTILASVTAGLFTNSVVSIGAVTGELGTPISLGTTPGRLSLSDNCQYLHAGLMTTGGIARINVASNLVDLTFPLGVSDRFGNFTAGDLQAVPSQAAAVAVSINHGSGNDRVAIFDDGLQRSNVAGATSFGGTYPIRFGASASTLYSTLPFDLRTISIDASGAQILSDTPDLVPSYSTDFEFDAGRIYFYTGRVVDPVGKTIVGTFPVSGLVAPDSTAGRIYFLTGSGQGGTFWYLTLRAFDPNTYTELWSVPLNGYIGYARRLINLGTNGLAFLTDANRMFVVRTAPLATPTADLSITQTVTTNLVSAGAPLTHTLSIRNSGPWTATGVVVSNPIPAGATFVSANSSRGTCAFTNGSLLCFLGTLTNSATATVALNTLAGPAGSSTNVGMLLLNELDPNPTNNTAIAVITIRLQPGVIAGDSMVTEGTGINTITFPLTLSTSSTATVSVEYQTADGTALAGRDYDAASGVVSFTPGSTSRSLGLSIIRSTPGTDAQRYFLLNLTNATNATLTRAQAAGRIVKQIFYGVSISGTTVETKAGPTNAAFRVILWPTNTNPVSVLYQTVDGSAIAGSDYAPRAGTLTFNPGTTNLTINVPVFGDPFTNTTRSFSTLLSQPQNAILTANEAVAVIIDDALLGPLTISRVQLQETNLWIQFDTIQGRYYRLERADDLSATAWATVADQIPGTGSPLVLSDAVVPDAPTRFYRLVLLP